MSDVKRWYQLGRGWTRLVRLSDGHVLGGCDAPPGQYVLASDYDILEHSRAESDHHALECQQRAEKAEAELDRLTDALRQPDLAGVVAAVRALRTDGFVDQNAAYSYVLRENLNRALDGGEAATRPSGQAVICCALQNCAGLLSSLPPDAHGFGQCVERRKGERRKGIYRKWCDDLDGFFYPRGDLMWRAIDERKADRRKGGA